MILAQAAAEAVDKPEWWQSALTPLGYVIAALIAGGFAVRLARKTPHENLKTLVEIRKAIPRGRTNLDEKGVLDAAIKHELENIATLTEARGRGFWAYAWARIRLAFSRTFDQPFMFGVGTALLISLAVWLRFGTFY